MILAQTIHFKSKTMSSTNCGSGSQKEGLKNNANSVYYYGFDPRMSNGRPSLTLFISKRTASKASPCSLRRRVSQGTKQQKDDGAAVTKGLADEAKMSFCIVEEVFIKRAEKKKCTIISPSS